MKIKQLIDIARRPLTERQTNFAKAVMATLALYALASPILGAYALAALAFLSAALAIPFVQWLRPRLSAGQTN